MDDRRAHMERRVFAVARNRIRLLALRFTFGVLMQHRKATRPTEIEQLELQISLLNSID